MKTWHRVVLLCLLALIGLGALSWIVWRNPKINFLPPDRRADWIIFPAAIDTATHPMARLDTRFRQEFDLARIPAQARLLVRAARECEIRLNGSAIVPQVENWKKAAAIDVTSFLREGKNSVEVRLFNEGAPPALWLFLELDSRSVSTDEKWEASFAGSSWRPAMSANTPRFPQPGNISFGGEKVRDVVPRLWLLWLGIGAAWALLIYLWDLRLRPLLSFATWLNLAFAVVALLWIALFCHNCVHLPFVVGFDAQAHLDYVRYLQERHTLPLPNEGFEMYQPPLFYAIAAGVLSIFGLSTASVAGITLLHGLTMLAGLAQIFFIFLTLARLFPKQPAAQAAGLVLSAFLPLQLYLSHYLTNETFCATLLAATVYAAIRILQAEAPSSISSAATGALLGAALLAKSTALLLFPVLLIAFAGRFVRQRHHRLAGAVHLGIFAAAFLVVAGWYYAWIWQHFGRPFVGNWDQSTGFSWWQDPGFRTVWEYLRFGRALREPFFSGLNSVWDGLYSTLWGDGLWGGVADFPSRPPWNYALVSGGYLLALVPMFLIILGTVVALRRFLTEPRSECFVLLAWLGLVISGMIFMNLKIAALGQSRFVYGLSTLIALAGAAALGWEVITSQRPVARVVAGALLMLWATNSFASVWIRPTAELAIYRATKFRGLGNTAAAEREIEQALKSDPLNARAHRTLSYIRSDQNRREEAVAEILRAIELSPNDSDAHVQAAILFSKAGKKAEALHQAETARQVGPENMIACGLLLPALLEQGDNAKTIAASREAMAVASFLPEPHYILGMALARNGEFADAAEQFAYALLLRPGWEDARTKFIAAAAYGAQTAARSGSLHHLAILASESPALLNDLAWLQATSADDRVRDGDEAVRLAEKAAALKTSMPNSVLLTTLAAAYAETGRFPEAVAKAEEALAVSRTSGNQALVTLAGEILAAARAQRPYRQAAP